MTASQITGLRFGPPAGIFATQQEFEHFFLWAPNFWYPASAADALSETTLSTIPYPRQPAPWAGRQLKQVEGKHFKSTTAQDNERQVFFLHWRACGCDFFQLGS